jgi:hypothetical protein
MELIIGEASIEFRNEIESVSVMFDRLGETLKEQRLALISLQIDHLEIKEDYIQYVVEQIHTIQQIKANVVPFRQLRDESIVSMGQYLSRGVSHIEPLAGQYYQGGTEESWQEFAQFIEALQWIEAVLDSFKAPDLAPINGSAFSDLQLMLAPTITSLSEAVEQADMTYIGDLLMHEVLPLFTRLLEEVRFTLMNEVIQNDYN